MFTKVVFFGKLKARQHHCLMMVEISITPSRPDLFISIEIFVDKIRKYDKNNQNIC